MGRIFISYKRANKEHVFQLVKKIEKQLGVKCWVDLEGIESSEQFASKICSAIDQADVVLFMHSSVHLSIDFKKDWTIKELTYAQNKNKHVVLVKLDNSPLDNIFLMEYGSKNNIDSSDPHQFAKLINDLRKWLNLPDLGSKPLIENDCVNLKILSNVDCKVLIDSEEIGIATAGRIMKIPLSAGEYFLEFVNSHNPSESIFKELTLTQDKIEKVNFLSDKQECEKNIKTETDGWEVLVPYISNNKVGFVNKTNRNIVIPCKYDMAFSFSEGLARVRYNGKWGFIDGKGNEVIPCKYQSVFSFSDGMARVKNNGKWGYVDKYGIEVIPCIYDNSDYFYDGLARVGFASDHCICRYINKQGKEMVPGRYGWVKPFSNGLGAVQNNGKWGYIDTSGKEIIPCKFDETISFSEGLAGVKKEKFTDWGYIDKQGNLVIPYIYDEVDSFSEGLAGVRLNNKWGYINKLGKEVIPCIYDSCTWFVNGLAGVSLNGKWGYIDKLGKEVIPCIYDDLRSFANGLAAVKLNGKWGYIDKNGNIAISYKYDDVSLRKHFAEGIENVKFNGKSIFIDQYGNELEL